MGFQEELQPVSPRKLIRDGNLFVLENSADLEKDQILEITKTLTAAVPGAVVLAIEGTYEVRR